MSIAPEVTEPLCSRCVERQGLCHVHARSVLPQLARPGWVRLIGAQAQLRKATRESAEAKRVRERKERKAAKRQQRLRDARMAELRALVLPQAA